MLAFDCNPATHFLSQEPFWGAAYPFVNDFDSLLGGISHGPVVRRPSIRIHKTHRPHRRHHVANHDYHPHHRQLAPRSSSFADLFNLLDNNNNHIVAPKVFSKVLETSRSYQLVFKKDEDPADFRSYLVCYFARDRYTDLIVESKRDEFKKVYRFIGSAIDIENVKWKVIGNVLIVEIPKAGVDGNRISATSGFFEKTSDCVKESNESIEKSNESVEKPNESVEKSTKSIEKATKSEKIRTNAPQDVTKTTQTEKRHSAKEATQPEAQKDKHEAKTNCRIISIPIEFLDSSEDVLSRVTSSTESLSETPSSPLSAAISDTVQDITDKNIIKETPGNGKEFFQKTTHENSDAPVGNQRSTVPKLSKKATLESIEDEAFTIDDLD